MRTSFSWSQGQECVGKYQSSMGSSRLSHPATSATPNFTPSTQMHTCLCDVASVTQWHMHLAPPVRCIISSTFHALGVIGLSPVKPASSC